MFCKNCGGNINSGSKFCKNCGHEVRLNKFLIIKFQLFNWIRNHKKGLIIAGIVIVVILAFVSFNKLPSSDNSSQQASKSNNFNPTLSVVNILCTAKNSGQESGGSGTIITKDGLIITNAHVIPQAREVPSVLNDKCLVILPDETTGQPKEIYFATPEITKRLSKKYDIAMLQIDSVYVDEDGKSWGIYPNTFPEFQDGPDCKEGQYIQLGDSVRIYGYPVTSGGYNLTITDGIVSSFNDDGTLLTSAKIDSGNSGGLAINQHGCFMGIPSAIVEGNYQNLGVIIPPNLINDFVNEIPIQAKDSIFSCNSSECYFNGQCITKPVNSSCTSNSSNDAWVCDAGYVESGNYCIKPAPVKDTPNDLCINNYGVGSYWNGSKCECLPGYGYNDKIGVCESNSQSCAASFPNTEWKGKYNAQGGLECDCVNSYVWNTTHTACVSKASVDQACTSKYGYNSYYLGYVRDGNYMCK